MNQKNSVQQTLGTETVAFIQGLPFWLKFLSVNLIEEGELNDDIYTEAIKYICEDLEIYEKSEKPNLAIDQTQAESQIYYQKATLTKLEHLCGANALKENMTIEFHPQLTILFGENGSGKTSYSRLLKWAFFSRSEEKILPNVFSDEKNPLEAKFYFNTDEGDVELQMPEDEDLSLTDQFSVFDTKAIVQHLDERNEFEFRPAGLVFFSELNSAVNELERRINEWIDELTPENPFVELFEGESEINNLITQLVEGVKVEEFDEHIPFSGKNGLELENLTKEHDELLIASNQLTSTIQNYKRIIRDFKRNKKKLSELNSEFSEEALSKIAQIIKKVVRLEKAVKAEGVNSIQSDEFEKIGSTEWREFVKAAHKYATSEDEKYPEDEDICIFCHQELSEKGTNLIRRYWVYLQSEAEDRLRKAKSSVDEYQDRIEKLSFDLFPEESRLTQWLKDHDAEYFDNLIAHLADQSKLQEMIIKKLNERDSEPLKAVQVDCLKHDKIIRQIEENIKTLEEGSQLKKLNNLKSRITYLNHRKKLAKHYKKIEKFVEQYNTVSLLQELRWQGLKRKITDCEKDLSSRYFSADYVERFNEEVEALNGQTQIEVVSRGTAGSSNRQLLIKGNNPSSILSESEQKVAAISDFLVEMELSEINKGLFFDDPSTTLDDYRKSELAKRLVKEVKKKQIIIFTHDLAFLSTIIESCRELEIEFRCHWIESANGQPGLVYLDNTPSFEKVFKTTGKAQEWYQKARKQGPEDREKSIRYGFASLRTSYEALVVFEIFAGVVQRFTERISVDSLMSVKYNDEIRDLVMDGFAQCCRYMEGHSHSDKYSSRKPTVESLNEEIERFNKIKTRIRQIDKEI